MDIILK